MDLSHRVRVPAPLEEVWAAVEDPARIGSVVPGSTVDSVSGDTFTGTLKIKLGPSLLALVGSGRYVSRQPGQHRLVVATTGTDRRGDAHLEATHAVSLARADGSDVETVVTIETSVQSSGRPARLGDGVLADAVDRVVEQTRERIAARVADGLPWVPPVGGETARDDEATAAAVVDHPVELGADLGGIDEPPSPAPSPSPGPAPRPPQPRAYVYTPYSNAAEPHVDAARTFARVVGTRVLPYAGLASFALFVVVSVVRRVRR